ncbi:hypothetical protein QEN19_003610 [Hanseniaspora menglaensis]
MSYNLEYSSQTSAFVSGLKFSEEYDITFIKGILLELFSQFTIIKNIHVMPVINKLSEPDLEVEDPIKNYSAILSFYDAEDLNHIIKLWSEIKNAVKINGFTVSVKQYNNKNSSLNNDKFISYAVVAIYNIIETLNLNENLNDDKDMIDYVDQQIFQTRYSTLVQFLTDKKGIRDINPQLQFLPIDGKKYKPFIAVQFDNFENADLFISSYNNTILFDNKNLHIAYAYKDVSDKTIGQYGDSLQRSLENKVTST